jgi:hypothetical protein
VVKPRSNGKNDHPNEIEYAKEVLDENRLKKTAKDFDSPGGIARG